VTKVLLQPDANVLKKYSQMKLRMKSDAVAKLNCNPNEPQP
jgi:hypothetical protein